MGLAGADGEAVGDATAGLGVAVGTEADGAFVEVSAGVEQAVSRVTRMIGTRRAVAALVGAAGSTEGQELSACFRCGRGCIGRVGAST